MSNEKDHEPCATKERPEYVESNDRCQICDKPCVGKYCEYHKELIRNGEL